MKLKSRKGSIKIFIVPFVMISFIFVITLFAVSNNIKKYYYDLKQKEALKIAQNISVNLMNTGTMTETANQLLEDNLLTSLKATALYSDFSDELLMELGRALEIDEIYVYNSEGIIEYSYSGKYIGWAPYVGHTMYNFINGDSDIFIENIRKDSDSDLYYKYGYIKIENGFFVQIGILADRVQSILDSFELQYHLEEMLADDDIVRLFSIDRYNRITASTDEDYLGSLIDNEGIKADMDNGKIYDHIVTTDDGEFYEIFVPLAYEFNDISAFGIQYSMDDIVPVIRNNTIIGLIAVAIVYGTLVFSLFMAHVRNKKLIELAFYDALTGLPNTESLKEEFRKDIIRNKGTHKAILMVKCGNLNLLNTTFGYEYGNLVLKEMGHRFQCLENKDIRLFKFTADKFVLYVKNYGYKQELLILIERIKEILRDPIMINTVRERITAKIGVVEYNKTDMAFDLDQLLKHATIALNYIDTNGISNYSFFDENMALAIQREEMIERDIRASISGEDTSKIYLVYQPIVDIKTNKIDGFEALVRMHSEQLGFVLPVELIDIAERKQLIIPLSNLILKEACVFISDLLKMGFDNIRVAVNISTIHLLQEDFVCIVLNVIRESGIHGSNLELEITETTLMENFSIVNKKLRQLRDNDIRISLDDFGTGYSSFDRLSALNVDTLKIDRYFINNITDANKASVITKDIISISHKLGLKTVAEGVECQDQKDYLLKHNCDKFQGFMFSKPVTWKEAIHLLKEDKK